MTSERTDVVVIGAGVAGLAAAAALYRLGRSCVLLEAAGQIGGRAHTSFPPELGGMAFDHGASWLHSAGRNPLVPLARAAGIALQGRGETWERRIRLPDRFANAAECSAYETAEATFEGVLSARARSLAPDTSLGAAVAVLPANQWHATLAMWEGPIIAAADPETLSLQDWHANLLDEDNLSVPGGLGALVATCLAPPPGTLRLHHAVTQLRWGDGVEIIAQRPSGEARIAARAAIVTVSTGVLRAGGIRFTPDLPPPVAQALDALPMGLLSKIAFALKPGDDLGRRLPPGASATLFHRIDGPAAAATLLLRPLGRDQAVVFLGGRTAWQVCGAPDAAEALARTTVAGLLGPDVAARLAPPAVITDWGADRLALGAYAYARPGHAGARAALGAAFADGRLRFAGEACHTGLAGTVAGAFLSGTQAAATLPG